MLPNKFFYSHIYLSHTTHYEKINHSLLSILLLQKLVSFEGIYEGTYKLIANMAATGYYVGHDSDKNINFIMEQL